MFNGKLLKLNFDSDPFLISNDAISLPFKIVADYAQRIVLDNDMSHLYGKAEIGRQSGNGLPVYLFFASNYIFVSNGVESCLCNGHVIITV